MTFRSSLLWVFCTLTLAYFLSYFFRSANAVIAEDLLLELKLQSANLGLMTSVFYLSFAASQPAIGWALDKYGSRLVQPVLLLVAALGALLFWSATGFWQAALARMLLGVGMAGCLMAAFKTFAAWFAPERYASAIGALMALGTLGSLFAASPLALFSQTYGWRAVFLLGALLTVAAGALIFFGIRNTPKGDQIASGKQAAPINFLDQKLWRVALLNLFAAGGLLSLQTLWAGKFLFDVYGLEKAQVGEFLTLLNLGAVLGYGIMGVLIDRFGTTRMALIAMLGLILCESLLAARVGLSWYGVVYFCFGFLGTGNLALLTHARQLFAPEQIGRATTFVNMFGIGGTFLLQSAIGFAVSSGNATQYSFAFAVLAACTFLALLWYLPLNQTRLEKQQED